jgi:hypothetical protein
MADAKCKVEVTCIWGPKYSVDGSKYERNRDEQLITFDVAVVVGAISNTFEP